jgi:hypothetical protein
VTGEVKAPIPWNEATTSKVDEAGAPSEPSPSEGDATPRFLKMSDGELKAYMMTATSKHAYDCMQPGGHLYELTQYVQLQRVELRTLRKFVDDFVKGQADFVQPRWLEVLATPAAIVVCTLLVLLYLRLHR